MPLPRLVFADATLFERFSSPENTSSLARMAGGERRRAKGSPQGLPLVSTLIKEDPFLSLPFFFSPGGLSRLYRMCRVSRQLGVSLLHVIKRANKKERDLVWAKPERKRCKITPLSAVPTRSLPATLGYLSCVVSSIALRYRPHLT